MEKLRSYIARLGISQNAFADQIGVSKGYLSQIASGKREPSREMIQKINVVTNGDVPPTAWFAAPEGAA